MFKNIVLIPSYNELSSLRKILKYKSSNFKFLIIDDGSTDGTKNFLIKKKVNFLYNYKNLGYEKSLIKAFRHLSKKPSKIDNVITFDADGEHKIKDILKVINFQNKGCFDLIVCNRFKLIRNTEKILSFLFFAKFGIKDPLTGFKLYNFKKLKKIINMIELNCFMADIVKIFVFKKYKVTNYLIKTNKIKARKPRVGNGIKLNFKIFKIFKLFFN